MNVWDDLTIRVLQEEDIEEARVMHNDYSTLQHLVDIHHVSRAEQARWLESISLSKNCRRYAVRNSCGDFVGVFRVDCIDMMNGSAAVGLDICQAQRGKGYAKKIYRYFFAYLFGQMRLNRLTLAALETNSIALKCYRELGFTEEGIQREAIWRNGSFRNLLYFGLLLSEYKQGPFYPDLELSR